MKLLLAITIIIFLPIGSVFGSQKINNKESIRVCKQALEDRAEDGEKYKFKHHSATSVSKTKFKHWINVTEDDEEDTKAMKLLCETTRTGEIINLVLERGRWNI